MCARGEGRKERKEREGKEAAASSQRALAAPTLPGAKQLQRPQSPAPLQPPAACWATLPPSVTRHSSWRRVGGAADPVIGEAATLQMKD